MRQSMIRQYLRETFFTAARHELAAFLKQHEEELLDEFRQQMRKMDERIPEEQAYIDVKMVPLGEAIFKATLDAIHGFLEKEANRPTGKHAASPR